MKQVNHKSTTDKPTLIKVLSSTKKSPISLEQHSDVLRFSIKLVQRQLQSLSQSLKTRLYKVDLSMNLGLTSESTPTNVLINSSNFSSMEHPEQIQKLFMRARTASIFASHMQAFTVRASTLRTTQDTRMTLLTGNGKE